MKGAWLLEKLKKKTETAQDHSLNPYYENISAHLGIFQVILYLSLFAFVVLSLARNTNLITYRNFYYFFKDLDASTESIDVFQSDSVTYPTSDSQYFTLYRGGLAVVGNNNVTVFTATGRQTVSQSIHYQNPMAEGTGKYLLVYEMGGTKYSLYNSYTQIYSGESEFPINGVAVSDSGMYAILSSSQDYTSVVSLYSSNFSLINRYNKNAYVTDISIDSDGKLLALLTARADGASFLSELELYEPGEESALQRVSLEQGLVLSCGFTESDRVAILSTGGVCFVDRSGEILSSYDFEGEIPAAVDIGEHGVTLSLTFSEISSQNHIIVFDKNGKMMYNETVGTQVKEFSRFRDSVFMMTAEGIDLLDLRNGTVLTVTCHTEKRHVLAVDQNEVLLCSPQKAEYIRFSS